jgi:tetratricopeptide (TPR) repeat protein
MARVADAERVHQEREARLREENSARALAAADACQSHDDAIAILRAARVLDPSHEGLGRALTIREQAAARERELAERRRLILEALAKADQISKHDAALEVLREAQRLEPESEDVRAAIVKREAALEHERELERRARERREQIAAALAKARQTKSHDAAVALLAEALRLDPQHVELRQAFNERQAALERERQARLAREREQRIAQAIKGARDLPSHDAAIALLREVQQQLDPDHQELRREIERRETALAREQEEARLRREREKKIAAVIAKAQKTASHEGAIAILQEAVGLDPDHENLRGMLEQRRNALAEERRQAEERLARIGEAITRASEMASHEMAISTLEEAHRLDPRHAGLREALQQRRAALEREQAEQRRLEERRRAIADGMARAAKTSHESAVRILEELAALDPIDDRIAELLRERRSALEAEREEARQVRIRQEQIAALISEAKSVTSHADAIAVLNRALALEPSDRKVKSLLGARSAALERESEDEARRQALQETRARITQLIERREFDAARAALADAERRLQAKRELRDLRKMLARTAAADTGVPTALRSNRRLQLGVAALLVLAVGVGYWIIGTPTPSPTPPGEGQQPIAQTAETPAPVPPQPADVNPVPRQPPVDVPVENPAAAGASRVAETIGQARLQLTRGDLAQAAAIVTKGLAADPADSQLSALGSEIVGQARAQAVKARAAADQRGEAATASPEYRQAGQRIVDAGGHERAGRYAQAARSLLDAQGLFIRAAQRTPEPPQVAEGPRPSPSPTEIAPKPPPPSAPVTPPVTELRSPEPAPAPPVAPPSTAAVPPQSTQPPATTATAKPPVSATPSVVSDEAGVRAALRAYELAYSNLNVEAVTRVYPSVNAAALRQSFDALRQQQVSIECDRIDISGITASATCQVRQSIVPRAGSRRTDSIRSLFRLQKVDNGWIIVERRGP